MIPEIYKSRCEALERGLRNVLATKFSCVRGLPGPVSQTNEEHVAFIAPSDKHVKYSSPEEAMIDLSFQFGEYIARKEGLLYWRVEPELSAPDGPHGWRAYARFLISDKPMVWRTMKEYDAEQANASS